MGTHDSTDAQPAGPAATTAQPVPLEADLELASLGSRAIAQVIDIVVVFAVLGGGIAVLTGGTTATGFELTGGPALLWFALGLAYFVVLEARPGWTVGKRVVGIAVRREDGTPASFGATLVRNLLRVVDGFFFYAVALVVAADSDRNQRLGDRIAGTVVVELD